MRAVCIGRLFAPLPSRARKAGELPDRTNPPVTRDQENLSPPNGSRIL